MLQICGGEKGLQRISKKVPTTCTCHHLRSRPQGFLQLRDELATKGVSVLCVYCLFEASCYYRRVGTCPLFVASNVSGNQTPSSICNNCFLYAHRQRSRRFSRTSSRQRRMRIHQKKRRAASTIAHSSYRHCPPPLVHHDNIQSSCGCSMSGGCSK